MEEVIDYLKIGGTVEFKYKNISYAIEQRYPDNTKLPDEAKFLIWVFRDHSTVGEVYAWAKTIDGILHKKCFDGKDIYEIENTATDWYLV